ncbi:MAG: dTMP kinase [Alphaproteobacteria bacterium]|nr:dTMP kinase [Alphaproteobacteria bacterium]
MPTAVAQVGRFITLEGGEGGGKTTQAECLCAALQARGVAAVVTREPGGSPGAEEIRALLVSGAPGRWEPATEALLHFAARRDHVARMIRPALSAGTWVICDRFTDSTMAYQGYAQGLGRDVVERIDQAAVGLRPDLTLVLDLPVEVGLEREKNAARYARFGADFHRKVRDAFLDIAQREPGRCVVIDATRSADLVAGDVLRVVEQRLLQPAR